MDIPKPLLRLFGLLSRAIRKAQGHKSFLPVNAPEPIHLTPSQRQQVETRIAEFIGDSSSLFAYAFGAIARLNGLPLYFDWTAFMALLPDGQIAWVPYDNEPGDIEAVQEERVRNLGLFQATKLHPDLQFLLPTRPSDAIDCPDCQGTGRLKFPQGSEHLADNLISLVAASAGYHLARNGETCVWVLG